MPFVDSETKEALRALKEAYQRGTMDEQQRRKKELARLLSQLLVGTVLIVSCPAIGFFIYQYASK